MSKIILTFIVAGGQNPIAGSTNSLQSQRVDRLTPI